MAKWYISFALAAQFVAPPVAAEQSSAEKMIPVIDSQAATIGMHYTLIGSRFANRLYWEIGTDGKGEIGIPMTLSGDAVAFSDGALDIQFDDGVHMFDIGPDGYAELQQLFENMTRGEVISYMSVMTDYECRLKAADDLPAMKLTWLEVKESRTFVLGTGPCMSAEERAIERQFDSAWNLIGKRMLASGQPGVSKK